MTIPNYLATFRRAVREREGKNEINEKSPTPLFRLIRLFRTPHPLKKEKT
jgi:hypothetical protein